jgi:uncharacterized membrane protein YphA (DoxX/SURF4 family)
MINPFATAAASNFGLMLARGTLGLYYAAIGYKGVMEGVSQFAREHVGSLPKWFLPQYGEVYLTLYPVVQVTAGILLTLGIFTRMSSFLLASTLLVFMTCTSGFHSHGAGWTVEPDWIFLGCTIALLTNGGGNMTIPGIFGKKASGSGSKAPAAAPAK